MQVHLEHLAFGLLALGLVLVVVVLVLTHLLALARFFVGLLLFAGLPPAAKRYYLPSVWAQVRWRWLTRNLGLAHVDPHAKVKFRGAIGPSIGRNVRIEKPKAKILYPRAVIRPDAYGLVAKVKTVPGVGRAQFEDAAPFIADYWRCVRVQVAQVKPGRLIVRGLRVDPLADRFGLEDAPAAAFTLEAPPLEPWAIEDSE
jgi:hypothetical protein